MRILLVQPESSECARLFDAFNLHEPLNPEEILPPHIIRRRYSIRTL